MIPELQKVPHQEYPIEKNMKIIGIKYLIKRVKMKKKKTAIVSGYFDPLHVGHLEYFKLAKELADELIVIVNNDLQCAMKKGRPFMDEKDRLEIVFHLDMVDEVILSDDIDRSVVETIKTIKRFKEFNHLMFCNGGDRNSTNSPEYAVCQELGIEWVDNLGEKIRSSSDLTGLVEKNKSNG